VKTEKQKTSAGQSINPSTPESDSKQPNRFLSSDETQPIESGRSSEGSDLGADVGTAADKTSTESDKGATRINDGMRTQAFDDGMRTQAFDEGVHLPSMFAAGLAPETKENLERFLTKGREALLETKTYVKDNPAEAAGLLACSGAILWALLGTKPGRRIVEYGTPLLSSYLASNFSQTFGQSLGQNLSQNSSQSSSLKGRQLQ
jgi:hypothetical protein